MEKKIYVLLCLLFSLSTVFGQGSYTIRGRINDMAEGASIELYRCSGNLEERIAVDTVKDGKFVFQGRERISPTRMTLYVAGDPSFKSSKTLWIGNQITEIKGNSKNVDLWKVKSDLKQQQEENKFIEQTAAYRIAYAKMRNEKSKEYEIEKRDQRSEQPVMKDYPITRMLDSLYFLKLEKTLEILKGKEVLTEVGMEWLYPMTRELHYSPKPRFDREELRKIFSCLDTSLKNSARVAEIHSYLYPVKVVKVGDPMADGVLFDLAGNEHRLSEYKGKYILLDFWSRGCGPCVAAHPELAEIAQLYRDSLYVISISLDTQKEAWKKASEKLECINLSDLKGEGGLIAHYGNEGIPLFVIVDREGIIVDKWMGYGKGILKGRLDKYWKEKKDGSKNE